MNVAPGTGAHTPAWLEAKVEIDPRIVNELAKVAPGRVLVGEPMARHTSFGLGGPADVFIEPASAASFRECAAILGDASVPVMFLGRGTNVLVRSGGLDGAVMTGCTAFDRLERADDTVRVGGGVGLARLLAFCADQGLSGLEGLAGIPGSVGGAVVMNAGSFGVSIGDRLNGVTVTKPGGATTFLQADELGLGYRETRLPDALVIEEIELSLDPGDPEEIEARQRETLERKWKTQPSGMRSAGCVFRNPDDGTAGRLIDEVGLKGLRVGGAVVSDQHANFIVNDRGATADDVEFLIETVRERVLAERGVAMVLEIEVVGRRADRAM